MTARKHAALPKARVLVEALPWLTRHHGKVVVIKFGGNAMVDEALKAAFAQDVVFLRHAGLRPVVVHGGGPQISAQLDRHGLTSEFTAGLRVTSPEAMDVVRMVLAGQVQRELVGLLNQHGPLAVGLTGEDAHTISAVKHYPLVDGEPVDIGRVGEITAVDTGAIDALLADGRIPVVSSIARAADDGHIYNVNADTAAAALAAALGAETLMVLTDVEGLYEDWPHSDEVISRLTASELEKLLPELSSGMVPKMRGCLDAVRGGVHTARVIDGRVPHSILLEIFTDEGVGTMVVADDADRPPRPPRPYHEAREADENRQVADESRQAPPAATGTVREPRPTAAATPGTAHQQATQATQAIQATTDTEGEAQ